MTRRSAPTQSTGGDSPALRLECYLRAKACITYAENMPDREYAYVKCSIYGVPKTNELFVRLTNGDVSFVAATASPVGSPSMSDRVFGIDAADSSTALALADALWEAHREQLLRKSEK